MVSDAEISNWSREAEGQFFERKSAFDRSGPLPKQRKAKEIARDIIETLSAMANADGGELVIGIEDDGTVTGVPHGRDKINLWLSSPSDRNYVRPPLRARSQEVITGEKKLLLHFEVDWSPEVHQISDGRYLLRIKDNNVPFSAEEIAALKRTKNQGLWERGFPPNASVEDLDRELVEKLTSKSAEEALIYYHLVERRNKHLIPCQAGLLLFGKEASKWHPRCGIEFLRWKGTERKHGADLNLTKRIRIDHPLAVLIEEAYKSISPFISERQQLMDLFFTEQLEYPTFVWQEAIVNAVAHRDYSIQGADIEVHMFDDRMEVRSPGLPPAPVTVDALNKREHVHLSRNPLIVRVLTDLGYMRELGEGIPRMFAEMEKEGFYPPHFDEVGEISFQVSLRNQPVYDQETLQWLSQYKGKILSGDQKRILAYAHSHGNRFTSREYQKLTGLDIYGASASIKDLKKKNIIKSEKKGSKVYVVNEKDEFTEQPPQELQKLIFFLQAGEKLTNEMVRKHLEVNRNTASRYLQEWVRRGWLEAEGKGRGRKYRPLISQIASPVNES